MIRKSYTILLGLTIFLLVHILSVSICTLVVAYFIIEFSIPLSSTLPLVATFFSSMITSTVILALGARRFVQPIVSLNEAIKEVMFGNYTVKIDEDQQITEIADMAKSFNKMVKELSAVEMLGNNFISNVSHEIKSPLATIEGYSTLLQDENLTREERNFYTQIIIDSTKQLSNMTNNILKLSKLENQELVFNKTNFKLDEQIREALLILESQWSCKNINLCLELQPTIYYGSEDLLMHVWLNILENAIKFTNDNGNITVELDTSNDITVKIIDDGIGISKETCNHIFEKFYQGDKTRNVIGNGLGLALAKKIMDLCNGNIELKSELNKGTTFIIKLPILSKII